MNALNLVGHDVEVFCRIQGHIHTGQLTKLTGPLPRTIHQNVTLDVALFGFDTFHAAFVQLNTCHLDVFKNLHAILARTFGQRHAQICWICFAIARDPNTAHQIVSAQQGGTLSYLLRCDFMHLHTKASRQCNLFSQYFHTLLGSCHIHTTALFPTCGQTGFGFQL